MLTYNNNKTFFENFVETLTEAYFGPEKFKKIMVVKRVIEEDEKMVNANVSFIIKDGSIDALITPEGEETVISTVPCNLISGTKCNSSFQLAYEINGRPLVISYNNDEKNDAYFKIDFLSKPK
jgi:hypothetical protein